MIRINLSGAKKEIKSSGGGAAIAVEGAKLLGLAIFFAVLGLAWVTGRYYHLGSQAQQIDRDMKVALVEKARLAGVKAQYEQQDAYKRDLSRRIDIIENLKRAQTGPLEMLNQMANSVQSTKTLWLTTFDNVGAHVNMEGVAVSANMVADFINSLRRSGYFTNVELKDVYQDEKSSAVPTFIFQLGADITPPAGQAGAAKPKS